MVVALVAALAGGVGAIGRYLTDVFVTRRSPGDVPLGTLLVNVVGSFLLGLLTGLVWYHAMSATVRLIVGTGFCGGLTTWSTATFESLRLVEERRFTTAALFTVGGLAAALLAAVAGLAVAGL